MSRRIVFKWLVLSAAVLRLSLFEAAAAAPCTPGSCNDGNPCTDDVCDTDSGLCVFTNNTIACDDGNACTLGDTCSGGACQPGTPTVCNDGNLCTTDSCNSATGLCVFVNNTVPCSDGNACTVGDTCGNGSCQPGSALVCDDNNVCTTDTCNTSTGCVFTNNTASCSDGNACTVGDTCSGGSCQPGTPRVCNDNNGCTTDTCNTSTGCVFTNNTNACSDGNACTVGDTCSGGSCQPGPAAVCNDNNVCTTDTCNTSTGCVFTNNTNACDDGNACTIGDTCSGGACQPGTPTVCNDGNLCTTDSCNPVTGLCVFVNNTVPCSDGNACTVGDTCGNGSCQPGSALVCNDNNVCTTDTCNTSTGCVFTNNTASCSDGNACTVGDTCSGGSCQPGTPRVCNDNNACTTDTCNTSTGCVFTNNSNPCSDGNACTVGDTCAGGSCQPGAAAVCNDNNVCTTDTCNTSTGCVFTNNTAACSDGNACTVGDTCSGGACQPGSPRVCNDNNVCTTDSCAPSTGCVFTNNTNACDDGNACTIGDTCAGGSCHAGTPTVCNDQNPCTDDTCNPATGACVFTNDDTNACSDGNLCTFDVCRSGVCVSHPSVNCDDGNPCTEDTCNGRNGQCIHTDDDANSCSDGNACTHDVCSRGSCVGTLAVFCNDGNACTDDVCNPATGYCESTPNDARTCSDGTACVTPACSAGACVCTVPLKLWSNASYPAGLDFGVNMGVSWGDYDADGRIDLFNAYSGSLWRNVGGTSWQFAADLSALVAPTERRYGSSFGDFDNDGLPDIAMAPRVPAWGDDKFHLFHNLGGGPNFSDIAGNPALVDAQPYGNAETLCWADVDGDTNLDLFVPVYPGSLGPGNFFLYNLGPTGPGGAYRFSELSGPVGLDVPPDAARPEGAQFADVDGDGDVDLFANQTIYQNNSHAHAPSFLPLSESASGVGLRGSMDEGAMFFDYDLDGDFDLVVAYVNEGVRIWENRGDGTFFPADTSIVDSPMTGLNLGMSAEDWDNDGDIDFTTRDVFRRNMLVEEGTRHFTVEHVTIPEAHMTSAVPAWGDWDGDGDLDCALGNWGDNGHLYENKLYTASTPAADKRYVRVRVVRDSPAAPRGLEVEYGAVAEIRLLNVADTFRRKKFVASSAGYLNQNEYTLQFGLPPRPAGGGELKFDVSVDFPGVPASGLLRIDKHVNPVLGGIDLQTLTDREITVDRSGRVVLNGVAYDPIADSQHLDTTGGGLALPGAAPLAEPTQAPNASWYAGVAFDTLASSRPIALREIILDGQLAAPFDCGSGPYDIALWDVTGAAPFIVAGGEMAATTSDRNRRSFITTDWVLRPGHVYRLVAHVTSFRMSPIAAPSVQDGLTVRGGLSYASSWCASGPVAAAPIDPTSVALAIRFVPIASSSCLGLPAGYCDDGNPCTDDSCAASGSCVHTNNSTGLCDDGNACTSSDHCTNGTCSGVAISCNDGNVCTDDGCDPAVGCTHTNNANQCNDGNVCTTVDTCIGGACVGGSPLVCVDGNPCTDDSCNPLTGCVFTPDNTNMCSDNNLCTSADHCQNGVCVGTAISCDDGNSCTTDSCVPTFGCRNTNFEVTGVRWSNKTTLAWDSRAQGGMTKYDVATGDGARLSSLGSGVSESCAANDDNSTTVTLTPTPAVSKFFWYLVRVRSNQCGQGTYGFGYQKPNPSAERILTVCP